MKRIIFLLVLFPVITFSQSRKQKKAQQKINAAIEFNLKNEEQNLNALESRQTDSSAELLTMQYLIEQYQKMQIEPKGGDSSYIQTFTIDGGKDASGTLLKVNDVQLQVNEDFFPLAYSSKTFVKAMVSPSLNESGEPWFIDLSDALEDNANHPNFNIDAYIKEASAKAVSRKATALLLYNSSKYNDNISFNKYDTSAVLTIPVIYITKNAFKKYFSDVTATYSLELNILFKQKIRKAYNVIGFINNNATNTVILAARYGHLKYNENGDALNTAHCRADENSTGTAVLLEVTNLLKQSSPKNNNYFIINFFDNELGWRGSKYWLEHCNTNMAPNYMMNIDMDGRCDTAHKLMIGGYGTTSAWNTILNETGNQQPIVKFDSTNTVPRDYDAFYRKNIPALFFSTANNSNDYKVSGINDYANEREIVQFIYRIIRNADAEGKLGFTKINKSVKE